MMAFVTEDRPISPEAQKAITDCENALLRKRMKELEKALFDALTIRGLLMAAHAPNALYAERKKYTDQVNQIEANSREILFKRKGLKAEYCKVS